MKLFHAGLRQNHLRALKFLQFSLNYVLLRLSVLRSLQAFETYCFLVFCAWCNIVPFLALSQWFSTWGRE